MLKRNIKLTAIVLFLVAGLVLGGCAGIGGVQAGWSGVVYGDGVVYLGSADGKLVALNSENGFTHWTPIELEGTTAGGLGCAAPVSAVIYGTPALSGDTIYLGDFSGRLYAFSVTDRQSKSVLLNQSNPSGIIASPLVSEGNVFIGSTDGNLYAFDASSLTEKWQFGTGGEIWAKAASANGTVFVGSFDKKVYAVDAESGQAVWDEPFETGGPIIADVTVSQGTVLVASLDRTIYALDALTGQLKWSFPAAQSEDNPERWFWASPTVIETNLFAPCMDGRVYVLDIASGNLVDDIDIGEPIASDPVYSGTNLIVATENGILYAIDTSTFQKRTLQDLDTQVLSPLGTDGTDVYVHAVKENYVYAIIIETGGTDWSTSIS